MRAEFVLRSDGHVSRYRVSSAFVLPGHRLRVSVEGAGGEYVLRAASGRVARGGAASWTWHAPAKPGLHAFTVLAPGGRDSVRLNAFVLVPAGRITGGRLNRYEMGRYPSIGARGGRPRTPPAGFVEVTPADRGTFVSPRFRLEQFL